MLEKGKISAFQMGIMMYPAIMATGFLALPTLTAQYAKNDLWLTGIFASLLGLVIVYTATKLHELYPMQTVIEYSEHIAGKLPGKVIGLVYLLFFLHISGFIAREYAEFVKDNFLFKTPMLLIISSMVLLAAFAVRGGLEMVARSAVIFTPLFTLPLFILLLLIPDLDVKNIFPVLNHGIIPVIKGTASPQAWISEFFLLAFFLPFLADPEKGRKWGFLSLCAIVSSMIYVNLISLFLFGPDTDDKMSPVFTAFRYIRVGDFFENLEAMLLAMWVVGNFVKIAVFYYAAVLSCAQWVKLTDFRPAVFPIGLMIVAFSLWDLPNSVIVSYVIKYVIPFYLPAVFSLIPLLLLVTAEWRKRKEPVEGGRVR